MTFQPVTHQNFHTDAFQTLQQLKELSFSQMLEDLLEKHNGTRKELLFYLWDNDLDIGQTSIDRYFNGLRFPRSKKGEKFIMLFAQYLGLTPEEKRLLLLAWELCRSGFIKVRSV